MPAVVVTKHLDIHDYLDAVGMAEATRFYLGMTEEPRIDYSEVWEALKKDLEK